MFNLSAPDSIQFDHSLPILSHLLAININSCLESHLVATIFIVIACVTEACICTVSLHKQCLVNVQIYIVVIWAPYQTAHKTGYFRKVSGA